MRSPHKWAKEIHAIADGKQTQWARDYNKPIEWNDFDPVWDSSPISSSDEIIWRIKPPEVAQWRKDMAQALEDGKVVEYYFYGGWEKSCRTAEEFLDNKFPISKYTTYRIRPEKKPDVVKYLVRCNGGFWTEDYCESPSLELKQLKVVFDGETGKPISAEVLK